MSSGQPTTSGLYPLPRGSHNDDPLVAPVRARPWPRGLTDLANFRFRTIWLSIPILLNRLPTRPIDGRLLRSGSVRSSDWLSAHLYLSSQLKASGSCNNHSLGGIRFALPSMTLTRYRDHPLLFCIARFFRNLVR